MTLHRRKHDDDVVGITSAPESPDDELAHRQNRYLLTMGIRTLCYVGAILAFVNDLPWIGAILLLGSFLLPAVAVVMANAASPRIPGSPDDPGFQAPGHHELGPGAPR
jgi:hypothetical protein